MRRILIATGEYLGRCLARELGGGYDVRCCTDGDTVLGLLEQLRPDGMIVELQGVDGLGILRNAVHRPSGIIVLTPLINDDIIQELEKQGVAYVFTTPCKVSSVVSALIQLIAEPAQLEGLI